MVAIRYAATEQDVTAIHRFLLVIAAPAMRCPVDVVKSLQEVIRVVRDEAAIMLMRGDMLVGTMGVIRPTWWYGNGDFLTDRWHFCLPNVMNTPDAALLLDEARAIAGIAGLDFIHQGKIRAAKNGVSLMMPRAYPPNLAVN